MKKILFISWDGPQTKYMEGLFLPIFKQITKEAEFEFHVLHFTWGDNLKSTRLVDIADEMDIRYTALPILRKPIAALGSLFSLFTGAKKIERYIKHHQINIVMPRSTMPAIMVNSIKRKNFKVIFDADGLPLEERVDFSGLSKESLQYRLLKRQEGVILRAADRVITRSEKSINIHLKTIGEQFRDKFAVVLNGRDTATFQQNTDARQLTRAMFDVKSEEKLFVYCGSMGPQYCLEEMIDIFSEYALLHPAKWLIICNDISYVLQGLDEVLIDKVKIVSSSADEVANLLNAADVAFALRKPAFSMQGVAPIKLGEYLLMGLPTVASKGIGDTEEVLKNFENCFLYDHSLPGQNKKVLGWLNGLNNNVVMNREKAVAAFSLQAASTSYINVLKGMDA